MKNPLIQGQHIIPDVYLKQFSFTTKGNHQKIKVLEKGKIGVQEQFVKSFNKVDNIFDIDSDVPEIERVFEEYHGLFETQYPNILKELSDKYFLADKEYSLLVQFTSNIISRSLTIREQIFFILQSDAKANFLNEVIDHVYLKEDELNSFNKDELFTNLVNMEPDKLINRVLMFFNEYLFIRLQYFKVIFFKAPEGKSWFTTNNPVLLENNLGRFNFLMPESDIYFPLNLKYLAYFHCDNSNDKSNILRNYSENTINAFPDNLFDELTKRIIANMSEYIVCPPEY
jgi:hypothetical protein